MAAANGASLTVDTTKELSIEIIVGYTHFGSYFLYRKQKNGNGWTGKLLAEGNSADTVRDIHVIAAGGISKDDVVEWVVRMHPMGTTLDYALTVKIAQGQIMVATYVYTGTFSSRDGGRVVGDFVKIT